MDKESQRLAFADLSSSLAQPFTSFDIAEDENITEFLKELDQDEDLKAQIYILKYYVQLICWVSFLFIP